jgi:anion-transporting  ArsA/GET3 family ATPase
MMDALLGDRSVLYVTGKGGVGKTTVAAALGLAAARTGRRTIVCEVAEQDRMSRAFARHGVRPEEEVELAKDLWAITIDPQRALEEWLGKQLGGGAARRLLGHSQAFQYFVAAAPGAKELITIAKVWELAQAQRWDRHNRAYDLVVVDAPASGHGIGMLTTPRTFGEIARVGPIRRQATKVYEMLTDPARTGYIAVALPEEMPVTETIELERRLRDAIGLGLDAIVMNAMWPERFSSGDVTKLRAAARDGHDAAAVDAVRAALVAHERVKAQRAHVRRLEGAVSVPLVSLPFVFESELGLDDYERLAGELSAALAEVPANGGR